MNTMMKMVKFLNFKFNHLSRKKGKRDDEEASYSAWQINTLGKRKIFTKTKKA